MQTYQNKYFTGKHRMETYFREFVNIDQGLGDNVRIVRDPLGSRSIRESSEGLIVQLFMCGV